MKGKIMSCLLAAAGTMLILSGCSGQSVTYDPNASQAAPAASVQSAAPTEAATPELTQTPGALTPTATPTPVPPTATPTEAPVITPIEPIEITPTINPDAGLKLIGEKKEGENVYKVRLKNATNFTIPWFSVKDNFTDYYPANNLGEEDSISKNETRIFYYDTTHGVRESAEREEKAEYLIRLALKTDEEMKDKEDEGHFYIIHNIPFSDLEEAEICFNEQTAVPYLKYKSKKTGAEVSTEAEETAIYNEERGSDSSSEDSSDGNSEDSSDGNSEDSQTGGNQEGTAQEETTQEGNTQEGNAQEGDGNREEDYNEDNEGIPDDVIEFDEDTGDTGEQDDEEYIDYRTNDDEIIYYEETDDNTNHVDAVG